ncbi:EF-hand domain-containing protein [Streptomyces sp. NPDC002446]
MSDVLQQKYEHRFRQLDADGDGSISHHDVRLRARLLADALGVPADDTAAQAAEAAADVYWHGIVRHTPDGQSQEVDCSAFVAALTAAREAGALHAMVQPAVVAHLALTDRDGDGSIDLREFTVAQQAVGIPSDQAQSVFRALDRDGDGRLTLPEWEAAVWEYYASTDPEAPGNRILGTC